MQAMNNVCQFPRHAAPAPNVFVSPVLRPFFVTISFEGERHELNVLAFKSCDAISNAFAMLFGGEYETPDAVRVKVRPASILPRAA